MFAAEPYENIGFKIPNKPVDVKSPDTWTAWDDFKKKYSVQIAFK